METRANYVLIGAFTILVTLLLLLFALWAAKYSSEKEWRSYAVLFNEPVTGLAEGSSVQYNGISGARLSLSTVPTEMPLYCTELPSARPVTGSLNSTA